MSTIATKYGYDKLGNRNMVIDPKENVTYFNYDLQGRLRSTISPDGNITYYEYNKVGSLTSKKDENGDTIDYTYDNLYRLTRKDYPDSTHAYFTYDAVGRRLHMQDANTLSYFAYDAGGRLTSTHDCILDKTISYTYDKVGRRDSMTDPEGDVIYYDYDSVKLIRIKRNTDEEAYYAYDAGGRRNYTLLGNGSYTYYDYDINGRLTRVANHKSDESVISSFEYTLDPVGNRIAMELASGDTIYYEYDGIYQLVQEDRRQSDDSLVYINYFEYDLAGNRTHLHYVDSGTDEWTYYTYNIENQLTIEEKGGIATYYEYDAAGALLTKKTGDTVSYYDYNYDLMLSSFADGETSAYYTYDTDLKRIQKDISGTITKYVYDLKNVNSALKNNLLYEDIADDISKKYALSYGDIVAEYDGNNTLQATYNTPALDQNLTVKIGEAVYHYLHDGLGSVRNLLDSDETIQNTYDYLAFGTVYGTPTENISNPFRFTSHQWNAELTLHYFRARMYDQRTGRFISKDPIFDASLYIYVKNNPVLLIDPLGLRESDQWDKPNPCHEPLWCLCCLVYGEARSTNSKCKEAVTWVILNRTQGKDNEYGRKRDICTVVRERNQFDAYMSDINLGYECCCEKNIAPKDKKSHASSWGSCLKAYLNFIVSSVPFFNLDPTRGSTWFNRAGQNSWASRQSHIEKVDVKGCTAFDFYRLKSVGKKHKKKLVIF